MKLNLIRFGEQTYVEGFWDTVHGTHSRDLWAEMPPEMQEHVSSLLTWADDEHEPKLVAEHNAYERKMEIDRQISVLNKIKAGLSK